MSSIHQFKVRGISGDTIDFADFKGKNILVVNVASECGFTPQYQQLQELYKEFQHNLIIVACPCNDFGGQEPGTEKEIKMFCDSRFKVSFPMTEKLNIINNQVAPIYKWLTQAEENGVADDEVKWNFHKYLLDEEGQLLASFPSKVSPLDDRIVSVLS